MLQAQLLARVAISRPTVAMTQIISDGKIEQSLQALRSYPQALAALHRADNASVQVKQSIEDHLAEVGYKWLT